MSAQPDESDQQRLMSGEDVRHDEPAQDSQGTDHPGQRAEALPAGHEREREDEDGSERQQRHTAGEVYDYKRCLTTLCRRREVRDDHAVPRTVLHDRRREALREQLGGD